LNAPPELFDQFTLTHSFADAAYLIEMHSRAASTSQATRVPSTIDPLR
jgi:hypothetical protein